MKDDRLEITCSHGKGIASVVCCHHLNLIQPVGFIENSSDHDDLQAWCYACEFLFQQEGDMTIKFREFNSAKVVCEKCYENFKKIHSIES